MAEDLASVDYIELVAGGPPRGETVLLFQGDLGKPTTPVQVLAKVGAPATMLAVMLHPSGVLVRDWADLSTNDSEVEIAESLTLPPGEMLVIAGNADASEIEVHTEVSGEGKHSRALEVLMLLLAAYVLYRATKS